MTSEYHANPVFGNRVLGLFAKHPQQGQVKTRLAAETSPEWAAQVAMACLLDSVALLATVPANRVLIFAPPDAAPFFDSIVKGRFALTPQIEGDLGQRMAAFMDEQFQAGAARVVLVGSDCPQMPLEFLEQAFQELASADVVLGPATDGGYYLIGCKRFVPALFENIPWSTRQVLHATLSRVQENGLRPALLPLCFDVDTLDDWRVLKRHVAELRAAGVDPCVPNTEQLLNDSKP